MSISEPKESNHLEKNQNKRTSDNFSLENSFNWVRVALSDVTLRDDSSSCSSLENWIFLQPPHESAK